MALFQPSERKTALFARFWPSRRHFSGLPSAKPHFLRAFELPDGTFPAIRAQNHTFCALGSTLCGAQAPSAAFAHNSPITIHNPEFTNQNSRPRIHNPQCTKKTENLFGILRSVLFFQLSRVLGTGSWELSPIELGPLELISVELFLFVSAVELINTTCCVDEFHLTCVEWVRCT